jgi:flagellar biogenesis protein FliO
MDIVRQSLAITIVFALLWGALWLLRKKGTLRMGFPKGRAEPSLIEARAKLILSNQHSVHLIRIEGRELVLATHPAGVVLLCDLGNGSRSVGSA